MKRTALIFAVLALSFSASAKGRCVARQGPPPLANGPVLAGLRIHEWGVFLAGGKATVAGGGGESPTFVQRVALPPPPEDGGIEEGRVECLEPVLHVYAPKPIDLSISVRFPGGKPLFAWPRAEPGWSPDDSGSQVPSLSWTLKTGGEGDPQPPKVPDDHWISAARKPGSDLVRSGKDAERFVFYEGQVAPLRNPIRVSKTTQGDAYLAVTEGLDEGWVLDGGREARLTGIPQVQQDAEKAFPLAALDPSALRTQLQAALEKAGLAAKEADALLEIWTPELVKPGRRLVYVLPRVEYDRVLPLTFNPAPEELKRVGLVVQELP